MGLDITAYRKLTPAPHAAIEDGYVVDWEKYAQLHQSSIDFAEENWPGRTAGTAAGVYEPAERFRFRAGSYSGYGWWRRSLAQFAYGKGIDEVWEKVTEGPFFELIHFADNEGVIGPQAAAKLAKDFAEHHDRAVEFSKSIDADGDWWLKQYGQWRRAFELAADGGAVDFH